MDIINVSCTHNYNQNKMSNIFKSNSRFSALVEDKKVSDKKVSDKKVSKENEKEKETAKVENKEERFNAFKSDKPFERRGSQFRPYDERERERHRLEREAEIKAQKEFEEREKERLKQESLSTNNFPELTIANKKENNVDKKLNFLDTLKKEEEVKKNDEDPDLVDLKPGWLLMKKDRETGNTVMKYGPGTTFYKQPKKTEHEIGLDILNALIELHERRTNEYIDLYGYETWEKMFKFPDWREREAYLEEMEELENMSDEDEDEDENEV